MTKKASLIVKSAFLSNLGSMAGKVFKPLMFASPVIGLGMGAASLASGLGGKFGNKARGFFSGQPAQPNTQPATTQPQNNTNFAPNSSLQPNQPQQATYPGGLKIKQDQIKTKFPKPQTLGSYKPMG